MPCRHMRATAPFTRCAHSSGSAIRALKRRARCRVRHHIEAIRAVCARYARAVLLLVISPSLLVDASPFSLFCFIFTISSAAAHLRCRCRYASPLYRSFDCCCAAADTFNTFTSLRRLPYATPPLLLLSRAMLRAQEHSASALWPAPTPPLIMPLLMLADDAYADAMPRRYASAC